jgi:Flp pilus assembly protein TadD
MAKARHRKAAGTRGLSLGVCLFLIAITWLVFGQTLGHEFVNFDDHVYVYENPVITGGLTLPGIIWAFRHSHARNWHPLTTISHMLDCQLFGLNAGGHHFTNVFLHTIAVVLLFLVLRDMTSSGRAVAGGDQRSWLQSQGALWPSAFVAALFAIHPLHVESVAWISERKDVLSGLFFMLTLGAYVRYARQPSPARYVMMSILFGLGLMSKPMLVTLPFVLLLLDYWPLGRGQRFATANPSFGGPEIRGSPRRIRLSDRRLAVRHGEFVRWRIRDQKFATANPSFGGLVAEKIPLLALSAASCLATLLVQRKAAGSIDQLPFAWRANNAIVTCVVYIWQMFWPVKLAVFYPHPDDRLLFWQVSLALALLIAITTTVIALRQKRPYLITGWFWYLGMLVPVIGLVQVGEQARADRYTYLPQIGLYLALSWAIGDLSASWRRRREILGVGAAVVIAALTWCAWIQTSYWENSETLWTHTLAVTTDNDVAHNNLGFIFSRRGELDEAISHFQTALNIRANNPQTHYNLGSALVHNNLANAFLRKNLLDEAIVHYEKAVELRPDYADAHYNLGSALLQEGRIDEAIAHWERTLSLQPNDAEAHTTLGNALRRKGEIGQAIAHYETALEIAPRSVSTLNNLAWTLSTCPDASLRNGVKAIELAQESDQLAGGKNPISIRTLAAAYAENGRFTDAIETVQHALQLATAQDNFALANKLAKDLDLYRTKFPLRDFGLTNAH